MLYSDIKHDAYEYATDMYEAGSEKFIIAYTAYLEALTSINIELKHIIEDNEGDPLEIGKQIKDEFGDL